MGAPIESSESNNQSLFLQTHSAALRIWHWLTFLVITGSILTVLLNSTILHPRSNVEVVQTAIKERGGTATPEQAKWIAHGIADKVWEVHTWLGFALIFLFLGRIVIEYFQPSDEKSKARIQRVLGLKKSKTGDTKEQKHYLIVKISYSIFYFVLLLTCATGFGMALEDDVAFFGKIHHNIRELHEFCQYLIYAFIFFHLTGILKAELGRSKGIVSGMINGGK